MRGIHVRLLTVGAAALTFGQGSIALGDQPKSDQPAASALPNDTGKRICKIVTPTGSRFTQRVCKTPDQWKHDEEQAQNMNEERRRNGDLDRAPTPQ